MSALIQLNYTLFQELNAHAGSVPWLDSFMIFSANTLIFFWPLLLLLVWGIPLNWRKRGVQLGETEILEERRASVLWVAIACLVAYALNLLIEQFVFEPRPFVSHRVHLLISHAADSSFPSDHSAWSFAVVGMLLFALLPLLLSTRHQQSRQGQPPVHAPLLRLPVVLLIVALIIALIIGLARIYVGVHYPGDILGGAIDGLLAASFVTWLRHWLSRPTRAVLRFAQSLRLA